MNEIISALQRVEEKAKAKLVAVRVNLIRSDALDYRAVFEMAYDHLRDTIYLFRHVRKLKQKLEMAPSEPEESSLSPSGRLIFRGGRWITVPRKEQDAPD